MKIKKNWSQFKELQAPLTQSASDRSLLALQLRPQHQVGEPLCSVAVTLSSSVYGQWPWPWRWYIFLY